MYASSALETIQTALTILGSVTALFGTIFGVWWSVRRLKENRREKQASEKQSLHDHLSKIDQRLAVIERAAEVRDEQWSDYKKRLDADLVTLGSELESITASCVHHQSSQDLQAVQVALSDLATKLDGLHSDYNNFKSGMSKDFVTTDIHRHDLKQMSQNFDMLWQTIRDTNALIGKLVSRGS